MNHNSLIDRDLETGLERWRQLSLQTIELDMLELTDDFREAQEGLGIVHRNPGEVSPEIIEYLWEEQNRSAAELEGLEKKHQELLEMDLPHLIVEYKQKRKEKPRWAFLRY